MIAYNDLEAENKYRYTICIRNTDSESFGNATWTGISNDRCVGTGDFQTPYPPSPITGLRATLPTAGGVQLTWDAPVNDPKYLDDIRAYQIQMSKDDSDQWSDVDLTGLTTSQSSFSPDDWYGGAVTRYRVRVHNDATEVLPELYADWAEAATPTIPVSAPSFPPRNVRADLNLTTNRVTISWDPPEDVRKTGIARYRVESLNDQMERESSRPVDTRDGTTPRQAIFTFSRGTRNVFRVYGYQDNAERVRTPNSAIVVVGTPGRPTVVIENAEEFSTETLDHWPLPEGDITAKLRWWPAADDARGDLTRSWTVCAGTRATVGRNCQTLADSVRSYETPALVGGSAADLGFYFIRVSGTNAAGDGLRRDLIVRVTQPEDGHGTTLYPPQNPRVSENPANSGTYVLEWDAPFNASAAGVTRYDLLRQLPETRVVRLFNIPLSETSHTSDDVSDVTETISWTVRSVREASGRTDYSDYTDTVYINSPPPPENLVAQAGDDLVILAWDPPASPIGRPGATYGIYRTTDPTEISPSRVLRSVSLSTTNHVDYNVNNDQLYYYFVAVRNGGHAGPSSNRVEATPSVAASTTPQAPTGLQVVEGDRRLELSWTAPEDYGRATISGYRIERSLDSGATWTNWVSNTRSTSTTRTDDRLEVGETRHYRVSAINARGAGDASREVAGTTLFEVPAAPTALQAAAATRTSIQVNWQAPEFIGGTPVTGYKLERSFEDGWYVVISETEGVTELSYLDDDSDIGDAFTTAHRYRVQAWNIVGASAWSDEVTSELGVPPGAPEMVTVTTASNGLDARVNWVTPTNFGSHPINSFILQVSEDGGNTWSNLRDDLPPAATSYTHSTTEVGNSYHYQVQATNQIGPGTWSDEVSIDLPFDIADWDFDANQAFNSDDALMLFYVAQYGTSLGSQATDSTAVQLRRTFLGSLIDDANAKTDDALLERVTEMESWLEDGARRGGDVNGDDSFDGDDLQILYYVTEFQSLLGSGEAGQGFAGIRELLLTNLTGSDPLEDAAAQAASLRSLVARAHRFGQSGGN